MLFWGQQPSQCHDFDISCVVLVLQCCFGVHSVLRVVKMLLFPVLCCLQGCCFLGPLLRVIKMLLISYVVLVLQGCCLLGPQHYQCEPYVVELAQSTS